MRVTIWFQAMMFKGAALMSVTHCPYTGEKLTVHNSHVDHEHPLTFKRLVLDFLNSKNIGLEDVAITTPADNQTQPLLADDTFAQDWRVYHAEHAKLRLLSKTGHLKHAKKGD